MIRNNINISSLALFLLICACETTQEPALSPIAPTQAQSTPEQYAELAIKRLEPSLTFLAETDLKITIESYRQIYIKNLKNSPDKPIKDKFQNVIEMVDETAESLKTTKDKKCVIERDMISADLIPIINEVELISKKHLSGENLQAQELDGLKEKYNRLEKIEKRIILLCQPYRSTLSLLASEAQLDATYVLHGGNSPGKATVPSENEIDELLSVDKDSK